MFTKKKKKKKGEKKKGKKRKEAIYLLYIPEWSTIEIYDLVYLKLFIKLKMTSFSSLIAYYCWQSTLCTPLVYKFHLDLVRHESAISTACAAVMP